MTSPDPRDLERDALIAALEATRHALITEAGPEQRREVLIQSFEALAEHRRRKAGVPVRRRRSA